MNDYRFRKKEPSSKTRPSVTDVINVLCVAYGEFTATEVVQFLPWVKASSVHTSISKLKRKGVVLEVPQSHECCPQCGQPLPESTARAARAPGPRAAVLTVREDILTELDKWYTEERVSEWLKHLKVDEEK